MKSTFAILALLPLLAACSTTTPAERLAANQVSCQTYGFKPGSDGYANCMMQQDMADRQKDAAEQERFDASMRQVSANLAAQNQSPVTCTTNSSARAAGYGNVYGNSTTTCY